MTSATDELRRLLDERGVEWTYGDGTVSYADNRRWFHAWAYNNNEMCVSMGYLTPEQAIAATLGVSHESVKTLIDDMLDFIGNCCNTTLDCACCDPVDCKYLDGDGELAECTRYQDFLSRAKAIAATLGGGECVPHGEWERISQTQEVRHVFCDCGYELGMDKRDSWPFKSTRLFAMPNFCPECGRELRGDTE